MHKVIKYYILGDELERCSPISHCWSAEGVVLLGCKKGFLLSLDCESSQISVLMECNLNEYPSSKENLDAIPEGQTCKCTKEANAKCR